MHDLAYIASSLSGRCQGSEVSSSPLNYISNVLNIISTTCEGNQAYTTKIFTHSSAYFPVMQPWITQKQAYSQFGAPPRMTRHQAHRTTPTHLTAPHLMVTHPILTHLTATNLTTICPMATSPTTSSLAITRLTAIHLALLLGTSRNAFHPPLRRTHMLLLQEMSRNPGSIGSIPLLGAAAVESLSELKYLIPRSCFRMCRVTIR